MFCWIFGGVGHLVGLVIWLVRLAQSFVWIWMDWAGDLVGILYLFGLEKWLGGRFVCVGHVVGFYILLDWRFGWVGLGWVGMQFWLAGFFIWLDSRLCFVGYVSVLDIGWVGEWVGLDRVGLELWSDLAGLGW